MKQTKGVFTLEIQRNPQPDRNRQVACRSNLKKTGAFANITDQFRTGKDADKEILDKKKALRDLWSS